MFLMSLLYTVAWAICLPAVSYTCADSALYMLLKDMAFSIPCICIVSFETDWIPVGLDPNLLILYR